MAPQQKFPPQHQDRQPGIEAVMQPQPVTDNPHYLGSGKLQDKIALVTGGDSGIGRAVSILFAKEGADVAILYLNEHEDAARTQQWVEQYGRRAITVAGDIGDEAFCRQAVERTVRELGGLDILVNNAAEQHPQNSILDISAEQLERTFRTNIFAMFYLTKAALPHMKRGSAIINTSSITAFRGARGLIDYGATKGAIAAFTRALAMDLIPQGIRVNAVAPSGVWTPLVAATSPTPQTVETFGQGAPIGRGAQPVEIAPCYVFLASDLESSYMTGEILFPTGGDIIT